MDAKIFSKTGCLLIFVIAQYNVIGATEKPVTYRRFRMVRDHLQNQIDSLRQEVKLEIDLMKEDLRSFLENGHHAATPAVPVEADEKKKVGKNVELDIDADIERYKQAAEQCKHVLKAFSNEKALNVQLRTELTKFGETMKKDIGSIRDEFVKETGEIKEDIIEDMTEWKNNITVNIQKDREMCVNITNEMKTEVKNMIDRHILTTQLENVKENLQLDIQNSKDDLNKTMAGLYTSFHDKIHDQCVNPLKTVSQTLNETKSSIKKMEDRLSYSEDRLITELQCYNPGRVSGVQDIYLKHINKYIQVFCDQETDEGGWIVIQRRTTKNQSRWDKYSTDFSTMFGDLKSDFWLGIDYVIALLMKSLVK